MNRIYTDREQDEIAAKCFADARKNSEREWVENQLPIGLADAIQILEQERPRTRRILAWDAGHLLSTADTVNIDRAIRAIKWCQEHQYYERSSH